ncbi:MAG: thioredoxin family protein [Pseudomonadota bacterium]
MKKIQILGGGCANCEALYKNAKTAAEELGIEFEMEKITELADITDFGVMVTPALAVDGDVKFSGKVATVEEIKKVL